LLAHVEPLHEMGGHANGVQLAHQIFADAVVQHALAVQHSLFGCVEGGGVVLEILDQGAGLGPLIEDFGLALVDLPAPFHGMFLRVKTRDGALSTPRRRPNLGHRRGRGNDSGSRRALPVAQSCVSRYCPVVHLAFGVEMADFQEVSGMSGFDERKKGFEAKWAHDEELRFKVMARRNKLLGLWVAGQKGLSGAAADAYAKEVVAADFE